MVHLLYSVLICSMPEPRRFGLTESAVEQEQGSRRWQAPDEDVPDWWPYATEFPQWHVWRGVSGLVYARRPRTSPPAVVRGKDAMELRDRIMRIEGRMA